MKNLRLLPLLLLLTGCTTSYRLVGAARDLPAGTVLQASDMKRIDATQCEHWSWATCECEQWISACQQQSTDASKLIGRKLLLSVARGDLINKEYTLGTDGEYSLSWLRRQAAIRRAAGQH